ncbi:MAG: tRNA lysidine(34) synthetase TilS [Eubacteriales bacterium]
MKKNIELSLDTTPKYLLALSGGADSVCLFHLLVKTGARFAVAHVNHGIRGEEALRDEEFCRALAEKHGVEFHLLRADVPSIARERGENVEEAARNVRYAFFAELMRENGIPFLLTAHNATDNAETLLLALARGVSPSGACGIPRERELEYGRVIRPLLSFTKTEITEYCRANSHEFVTDSTNSDVTYSRNRIRHRVLPELEIINPAAAEAISRFTQAQREDGEFLDGLALDFLEKHGLDREKLCRLACPVAKRVLAISARRAGAAPESVHVRAMLEALKSGAGVSLPGGVVFAVRGEKAEFAPECRIPKRERSVYPDIEPIKLCKGENRFGDAILNVVCSELTKDCPQVHNLSTKAHINLDTIKEQLIARPRREGDRILIGGRHRSVKKLISERMSALPLEVRRALPVITDGEEIVWVPGLAVADAYDAKNSGKVLTVDYCI